MKFSAGRLGGERKRHGTHDGKSFGVEEIRARKSNVPKPSRTSAQTSFQGLFLGERATSARDSNALRAGFNFLNRYACHATQTAFVLRAMRCGLLSPANAKSPGNLRNFLSLCWFRPRLCVPKTSRRRNA